MIKAMAKIIVLEYFESGSLEIFFLSRYAFLSLCALFTQQHKDYGDTLRH